MWCVLKVRVRVCVPGSCRGAWCAGCVVVWCVVSERRCVGAVCVSCRVVCAVFCVCVCVLRCVECASCVLCCGCAVLRVGVGVGVSCVVRHVENPPCTNSKRLRVHVQNVSDKGSPDNAQRQVTKSCRAAGPLFNVQELHFWLLLHSAGKSAGELAGELRGSSVAEENPRDTKPQRAPESPYKVQRASESYRVPQ